MEVKPKQKEMARYYVSLPQWSHVSYEDMAQHLALINSVEREMGTGVQLDWTKFPLGVSREELVEAAQAKQKAYRRRAGARTLVNKYGPEAARRLVAKKTGKTIKFQ